MHEKETLKKCEYKEKEVLEMDKYEIVAEEATVECVTVEGTQEMSCSPGGPSCYPS